MTAVVPHPFRAPHVRPKLLAGLVLAAAIAFLAPFDRAFAAASLGQPVLQAALIVALALAGAALAQRVGLSIEPPAGRASPLTPLVTAVSVGVWCAGVDWTFRAHLGPAYLQLFRAEPLSVRTLAFMARAFNENILYRLFLGSALAWLLGRVWRTGEGRPAAGAIWSGFALSQALNVWINVASAAPLDAVGLIHDALRYFVPGMVWSGLYWRRGFQANEIASTSVHLVFQPLAGLLLAG